MKRRATAFVLLVCLVVPVAALDSKKASYIGGTVPGLKEQTEGRIDTSQETAFVFTPDKPKNASPLTIPYSAISSLEYGQKAGRRVGVAIMVSPLALFSKKRKHYLTITFADPAGKEQAGVFELGKDLVRTTLTIVETRSGKEIEYQDDDARKSSKG